jgi:hypothetical protein
VHIMTGLAVIFGLFCLFVSPIHFAGPMVWAAEKVRYIDAHAHLFPHVASGGFAQTGYEGAAARALKVMADLDITETFLMPPPFTRSQQDVYDIEDLLVVTRKYPGRFALLGGGGTLNVMIQETSQSAEINGTVRETFERRATEIIKNGAVGFGEMTAEHFSRNPNHPYESAPPDHPLFLLLADIAARHDVPVDIHMEAVPADMAMPPWLRKESSRNPPTVKENISRLEKLLAHNWKTRIIWAHAGWDLSGRRTPELMKRLLQNHPNLYMSLKIHLDRPGPNCPIDRSGRLDPEWLSLFLALPDRFIVGSDEFHPAPGARPGRESRVEGPRLLLDALPQELARKIGHENVLHVFTRKGK